MSVSAFLIKNKDLLEIIFTITGSLAAILLGIMAIVLTANSNKIAQGQFRLAERELALSEAQAKPRFRTSWKQSADPKDPSAVFDSVELWNDGPALTSLYVMQFSFLELDAADGVERVTKHLPIYYLFDRQFTGEGTGLLVTLSAYRSLPISRYAENITAKFNTLDRELVSAGYGVRLRVFLSVGYSNVYDNAGVTLVEATGHFNEDFYSGPGFSRKLPDSAINRLTAAVNAVLVSPLDIDKVSVDMVQKLFPRIQNLSPILDGTDMDAPTPDR